MILHVHLIHHWLVVDVKSNAKKVTKCAHTSTEEKNPDDVADSELFLREETNVSLSDGKKAFLSNALIV